MSLTVTENTYQLTISGDTTHSLTVSDVNNSLTLTTSYVHPAFSSLSIDTSGAQVLDTFTSNSEGHVTGLTLRTLTLADLGYTGETDATADQTAAEIRTLVGDADDSNVFTDNLLSKLQGISVGADVTPSWVPELDPTYATESYVDTLHATQLGLSGGTMTGDINMGGNEITNVGNVDGRDVSADGATLDTVYGWGDHATEGYSVIAANETISGNKNFTGTIAVNGTAFTSTNISNWNTAYGWGDHSVEGYATETYVGTQITNLNLGTASTYAYTDFATAAQGTNADTAYGWGDHGVEGYSVIAATETITGSKNFTGTFAVGGTAFTSTNISNWNTAYGWGDHGVEGYATETYVDTAVSNLVDSAPAALDTLNELAAALGDDANFSTTMSTALGNRLRVDIGTQGLTSTQQGYGRTNLGLGTAATSATTDFATAAQGTNADTAYGWGDHSTEGYATETYVGTQITNLNLGTASTYAYTDFATAAQGSNADTAYGWGDHGVEGYSVIAANETISGNKNFTGTIAVNGTAFTSTNISNWNTAYGWGDHSVEGYATETYVGTQITNLNLGTASTYAYTDFATAAQGTNADTAYGWGDHGVEGYSVIAANETISGNRNFTGTIAVNGTAFTSTNISNWNTAYGWGDHSVEGYATETYVNTAVSNLVDSAPAALDTLNELAAALGDDANFSTTMSTALGNRLRVDINTQNLTSTEKQNGRTNLGLGTAATSATTDFATAAQGTNADTAYGWGDHGVEGYSVIAANETISGNKNFTGTIAVNGTAFTSTNISNWNTAYGWGDHSTEGYLTGNQTITLSGDVSGSGTTSIVVTVADDSHNHIIANVDGLQDALDNLLSLSGDTMTGPINMGGNDITNAGEIEAAEFIGDLRGAVSFIASAGEALSAGDAVYISGISGNTTVVSKADANDASKMPAFGIAKESANQNANVTIINFGEVSNLDTSAFAEGDELFVSTTAGVLTDTAPTGESSLLQKIAKVTRSHASTGSITVMGAGRTNAVPNLNEGNLFVGNASNQAVADDTLHVDIANARLGVGTTPSYTLDVAGTMRATAGILTGDLSMGGNDITNVGTVDGRDVSVDGSKLDTIESGATGDQTAAEILTAIKTVDGATSGLDADLLDGNHASAFATAAQGTNADTAYGWGDHGVEGYSVIANNETISGNKNFTGTIAVNGTAFTSTNISNWNTAYGWGDHSTVGYLTSLGTALVDADFGSAGLMATDGSGTYSIVTDNSSNWNTAYGWGDHAAVGYLTSETYSTASELLTAIKTVDGAGSGLDADTLDGYSSASFATSSQGTNADTAYGWGDHGVEGYATETYVGTQITNLNLGTASTSDTTDFATAAQGTNADTAYGWGDHGVEGYSVIANNETISGNKNFTGTIAVNGTAFTSTNISNWNTAYGWGDHSTEGYATETYVNTAVSNLVASAPAALDTLNELAAALGDDANFSQTVSDSLGNRLRVDINNQNLTSTQKQNGRTNLGLGTAATSATTDFATAAQGSNADTAYGWGDHATVGYLTSETYSTASELLTAIKTVDGSGSGLDADTLDGYSSASFATAAQGSNADTAYGWGDHAVEGYLTSETYSTASELLTAIKTVDGTTSGLDADLLDGNHASVFSQIAANETISGNKNFTGTIAVNGTAFTSTNISNWNTAYGWGDHASAGYLTSLGTALVDADFATAGIMATDGSGTYSIVTNNSSNWNTAYSWGDHATVGYLTSETYSTASELLTAIKTVDGAGSGLDADTLDGLSSASFATAAQGSNADTAYGWGDHAAEGYLTSETYSTASELLTAIKTVDGSGSGLDADTVDGLNSGQFIRSDANDYVTGHITGSGSPQFAGFFMPQNPEGNHVKAPWFFNDMAYARLRGATVSVTVTGGSSPSNSNIDAMLDASTGFWNMSTSGVTEVVITMSNLPKAMSFGSHMGVTFGNTTWRAKNVKLESYYNGQWNELVDLTNQSYEYVTASYNSSSNAQSQLRWTFSNFNTTSMRIVSLFAYNYNATGMPSLYLTKDGGEMYGNITMSGSQTVDGRDLSVDGAKLDNIEAGATADQTPAEILTAIKTVDGSGSGLDADLLDGNHASVFSQIAANETISGNKNFTGTIAVNGTAFTSTNISNWNTAYGWGDHSVEGYATETYVDTAVSNLVASAPAALDTLNELAAALGDDANFSTTMSTALGNRLRVDTASQGLTSTQQSNGRTNLGLGSAATASSSSFATSAQGSKADTAYGWGDHAAVGYLTSETYSTASELLTAIKTVDGSGSGLDADLLDGLSSASFATSTQGSKADTAYGWGDHAAVGYLTSETYSTASELLTAIKTVDGSGSGLDADTLDGYSSASFATAAQGSNADTAYGWGNHASAGYLTSETYSTASELLTAIKTVDGSGSGLDADLLDGLSSASFATAAQGSNADTAYGWGDHSTEGYSVIANNETISGNKNFTGTIAVNGTAFTSTNISNWNTAYGWGNHASAGYLTTSSASSTYLPLSGGTLTGDLTLNSTNPAINFNGTSDGGVDMQIYATPEGLDFREPEETNKIHFRILDDTGVDAPFGYHVNGTRIVTAARNLENVTANASIINAGTFADARIASASNWNTAYGWGDHSTAGYLTSLGTAIVDGDFTANGLMKRTGAGTYTSITDNSTNWNTAYGWGNHASVGYLTGNQTITLSGDVSGSGTTNITVTVADDSHNHIIANVDGLQTALNGKQASISAPNAPTSVSATVVGETVDVTFNASTTSNIDAYLVYSSVDGSNYGLISVIPPDDFSATMSVIDTAFTVTGTQAYRVYAMKYGVLSSAGTASVSYTVSSAEPTDMSVVNLNNAYYIQWNPPSSNERFVTAYNVYKHEASTTGALSRASASLVYSGMNTNFMYQISGSNNNNYHQFWVETTIA